MTRETKELLIARIIAGNIFFTFKNQSYVLEQPSQYVLILAGEIYFAKLKEALLLDVPSEHETINMLEEKKIWTASLENELEQLRKNLETLKIAMYNGMYRTKEKETIRKGLRITESRLLELNNLKTSLYEISAEYMANIAKHRYIIKNSLYKIKNKTRVSFPSAGLLNHSLYCYFSSPISDKEIRELARTDPWHSIWFSRKANMPIFSGNAATLTYNQKNLIGWSIFYDNLRESTDCPPDAFIDDDDIIDGWIILQNRKRQQETISNFTENFTSDNKIKQAGEIYLFGQTKEDVVNIEQLNDIHSRMTKQQRMSKLVKHGHLNEMEMPDTKQKLIQEATRMIMGRKT